MNVKLTVKFGAGAGNELGIKDFELIGVSDLKTSLKIIEDKTGYPLKQKLNAGYVLLINGRSHIFYLEKQIPLQNGDTLFLLPVLGGG